MLRRSSMGTFLEGFPSPRPLVVPSADAEFSSTTTVSADHEFSSLLALLAMHDDDDVGGAGAPQPGAPFAAADASSFPAFFAAHEHYDLHHQQAGDDATMMMMPFPPPQVFPHLPVDPGTITTSRVVHGLIPAAAAAAAAGDNGATYGRTPRLPAAKRRRPHDDQEQDHHEQAPARARASRRVWVLPRSTEWWDRLSDPSCPDAEFRRAFRMSRATFGALCHALGGAVAREDTALRAAIPVRRRVAVCLWRLAAAEPLREVSRRFGLGISTCHSIVAQVTHALATFLRPAAIRWPEPDGPDPAAAAAAGFGIPAVVGAVYTTRVPVVTPKASVAAYYDRRLTERNKRASYSVAVQAVTDAAGAFTDVRIRPGALSDAAVLAASALPAELRGGHGLLVGGASYPLTDAMLVPYAAHQNLTWEEHSFNERVAAAREAARGAVRRLKARWRCLQRRTEVKDLHSMIVACCVLHNFCERAGEEIDDPDLMQYELDDDDDDYYVAAQDDDAASAAAAQARDRIAHGLLHGNHQLLANCDSPAFQS